MDPNKPQQVLPNYKSNDPNIPSYNPEGITVENDPNTPVIKGGNMNPNGKAPETDKKAPKKGLLPKKDKNAPKAPKEPKEKIFDTKKIVSVVAGVIAGVVLLAIGIVFLIQILTKPKTPTTPGSQDKPDTGEVGKPEEINLQLALNQWITDQPVSDNSAIVIYDIDNDSVVARHNEDNIMWMGNLYQMLVAYEGYYRINHDLLKGEEALSIGNDFNGNPYSVSDCLDHMIRYSYQPCSEALGMKFGWDKLQAAFTEQGLKNTNILGLTSSPSDFLKLYQMYWNHHDFDDETWKTIKDSLFAQTPATKDQVYAQNWRKGLPSGFSKAMVYNKTGFYSADGKDAGDISKVYGAYNDAAFVIFPEVENKEGVIKPERHYIMIIMTKDTKPQEIVKLGRKLEDTVTSSDNY